MTLEQIKYRQESINEQLYTLLQNTERVINTIVGETPLEGNLMDSTRPNGFLQEISRQQDVTQVYIEGLTMYNQSLINYTYAPSEDVCQPKANY